MALLRHPRTANTVKNFLATKKTWSRPLTRKKVHKHCRFLPFLGLAWHVVGKKTKIKMPQRNRSIALNSGKQSKPGCQWKIFVDKKAAKWPMREGEKFKFKLKAQARAKKSIFLLSTVVMRQERFQRQWCSSVPAFYITLLPVSRTLCIGIFLPNRRKRTNIRWGVNRRFPWTKQVVLYLKRRIWFYLHNAFALLSPSLSLSQVSSEFSLCEDEGQRPWKIYK